MLDKLNKLFSGITIIITFWGLFWLLNGLDKFYNGSFQPNLEPFSTNAVLISPDGDNRIIYELHPMETVGWFGINRDAKMIGYFNRLGINKQIALACLYFLASVEVIVGLGFISALFIREKRNKIVRLTFKISMAVFFGFSIFDILFGDRMELWEHGTFLILATIHYVYILFAVPGKEFDQLKGTTTFVLTQMRDKILEPKID